ncbi:hypothetical protein [Duganella sp. Root198D2]|uniref:hypothetical protein n=1 Tax=Duganella sp. Root198D2 TaxID=1736489 RepID=UPI00138F5457|nr:hypothetical protein [Duganella sp. Root198D2]
MTGRKFVSIIEFVGTTAVPKFNHAGTKLSRPDGTHKTLTVHGSPRLFQQGETMPPAVIQRDLSFIERLKGANAQIDTNTVWRLVKYAEVPSSLEAPTLLDDRGMLSKET